MFRIPAYFIFVFVGLSILTAYFVNRWQSEKIPRAGNTHASVVRTLASQIPLDISSSGLPALASEIQFEDPESCGESRNFLQSGLAKIPSLYRDPRARRPAEFPRECMTYILRKSLLSQENKTHSFMGQCAGKKKSQLVQVQPCVTANYVNSIYNSFGDLTTCFGIPQRDLLPLLLTEGGFQMNGMGPTVDFAKTHFADYKNEILLSHDEACQNLTSIFKNLEPVNQRVAQQCQMILPPENPILNIFYLMIKYKQDRKEIEKSLQDPDLNVVFSLREQGLSEKDYDREQLIQMMTILAVRLGARGAVLSFKGYLELMASMKRKLTLTDFDFASEDPVDLKTKLTFQAYLMNYQHDGHAGYFSSIKRAAKELKDALKGGICVPDSYLSL